MGEETADQAGANDQVRVIGGEAAAVPAAPLPTTPGDIDGTEDLTGCQTGMFGSTELHTQHHVWDVDPATGIVTGKNRDQPAPTPEAAPAEEEQPA